jgi:hypothetical protein
MRDDRKPPIVEQRIWGVLDQVTQRVVQRGVTLAQAEDHILDLMRTTGGTTIAERTQYRVIRAAAR